MPQKTIFEYTIFGTDNPFAEEHAGKEESFQDNYIVLSPRVTIKQRDRGRITLKFHIFRNEDGVDIFTTKSFGPNLQREPLQSFLLLYGAVDMEDGVIVDKKRHLYRLEKGISAHFCRLEFHQQKNTALTFSGMNPTNLTEMIQRYTPDLPNTSFADFLCYSLEI